MDTPPLEKSELNLAEKFYLEQNSDKPVEKIAEALRRTVAQVQFELNLIEQKKYEQERVVPENPRLPVKDSEVTTVTPVESPLLKSFIRRKEGGVLAMNSGAAQMSDELAKQEGKKTVLETRPDCVTRVRK